MTVISGWLVLTFKTIRAEVNQFEFDFNNLNSKCITSIGFVLQISILLIALMIFIL
jgi:hypothetical protein